MKKTLSYAIAAIAIVAAAAYLFFPSSAPKGEKAVQAPHEEHQTAIAGAEAGYYTCPMHPSVRSDRPGACPICGMALVRRAAAPAEVHSTELGPVTLSPSQQVLANVSIVPARTERLSRVIDAVGRIDYAEPSLSHITLRFPARIERLHVNFTGEYIRKGGPLADVYSPEAVSAQREYLLALESVEQTKDAYRDIAEGSQSLLAQSRQKLARWGFTQEQLSALEATKHVIDTLTIFAAVSGTVTKKYVETQQYLPAGSVLFDVADLSTMWLLADIYEADIPWVRTGQPVDATAEAYPGEHFSGSIGFIDPLVDQETRTTRVRINMANAGGRLKPGMFVQVRIRVALSSSVVVPVSAVLSTGKESVVWIEHSPGVFQPRRVTVGSRSDGLVQILSGLAQGESVVATGGYLLDSESQLQITTSPAGGAQHTEGHE